MSTHNATAAELIAVIPDWDRTKPLPAFVGQCINYGIELYFDANDTLPSKVPSGVQGVRAILLEQAYYEANRAVLEEYERQGTDIHIFHAHSASGPQLAVPWENNNVFHQIVFNYGITVDSTQFRSKMLARSDQYIFDSLETRMLQTQETRWYDATKYNWEGLLNGYEVTGDIRYLNLVREQIESAIENQPNNLENCDCVAPFTAVLRLYELETDSDIRKKLLDYAKTKMGRYLEITPLYKGCLVNFLDFTKQARAEIALQVCPALTYLWKVTGEYKYADIALDQLEKLHAVLFDSEANLWRLGTSDAYSTAAFWSRGVAFTLSGLLTTLEYADHNENRVQKLLSIFRQMAERVRELQSESGFWFQIVDDPCGEKESSGTAWNAATFERAMRLNLLDSSYRATADAAWNATKTRICNGDFPGHSYGTTVSPIYTYFSQRGLSTSGWTHFPFQVACERRKTILGL